MNCVVMDNKGYDGGLQNKEHCSWQWVNQVVYLGHCWIRKIQSISE